MVQLPVVPTPLPDAVARFDLSQSYSLWAGAETAVTTWQLMGQWATILQLIIIIGLVLLGVWLFYKNAVLVVGRDSEE